MKRKSSNKVRTNYSYIGKSKPNIFGKINSTYTLQLGYGKEQMLFPSLMDGNFSVSIRYLAGPAIAILKPYYLNLIYVDYNLDPAAHIQTERYSTGNANQFLNAGSILAKNEGEKGLSKSNTFPTCSVNCILP